MNILRAVISGPTAFRGEGVNELRESFAGELKVQVLEGGRAVLLSYTATLLTGTVVHTESTLLGTGPNGKLCLWPVMSEIPLILPHTEITVKPESGQQSIGVFGSGQREESTTFREEITIQVHLDGSIEYAHAWGLPGGAFEDRSSCRMAPIDA